MNTIGLLLVLGLAFFALKQKSEKTRNMLLIASALLGFCMFSAEGFMVQGATGTAGPATCTGTATDSSVVCADSFTAASGGTAASCPAGCTYTAVDFELRDIAATDLPLLFPSCLGGSQVKAGGTLNAMCEEATPGRVSWEDICGPDAECDGSIEALGASALAEDKSNQCGATFNGTWASTCKCTDDDKTWTSGTSNGCTAE
jgi:hypothetical protein